MKNRGVEHNSYICFRYENYTPDLGKNIVRAEIKSACDKWTDVSGLTLEEIEGDDADIMIRFGSGPHGCNYPFSGPGEYTKPNYF